MAQWEAGSSSHAIVQRHAWVALPAGIRRVDTQRATAHEPCYARASDAKGSQAQNQLRKREKAGMEHDDDGLGWHLPSVH